MGENGVGTECRSIAALAVREQRLERAVTSGGDDRDARHDSPVASPAHHPKVDLRKTTRRARRGAASDPSVGRRMAEENPTCGDMRIRGALTNVGRRVGRSTTARILKAQEIPPVPERPTSWQALPRAPWGAIATVDFLTTEVWTWRGRVTHSTLFVIDVASRRVRIVGSTVGLTSMWTELTVLSACIMSDETTLPFGVTFGVLRMGIWDS